MTIIAFLPFTVIRRLISPALFMRWTYFFHRDVTYFKTKRSICSACLCEAWNVRAVDKTRAPIPMLKHELFAKN